ncbi:sodium:proton antiporter [bacterium]|nr:sodium:proton antiporter [bacterium]
MPIVRSRTVVLAILFVAAFALFAAPAAAQSHDEGDAGGESAGAGSHDAQAAHGHGELGKELSLVWAIPFAAILLSIALFPLVLPHFWHKHFPKVSAVCALAFAVPFLVGYKMQAVSAIWHIVIADFIPFIILLSGLFTVAGGIVVRGSFRGSPAVNVAMILIGTILASWIGTTGAAMVMIRPLLRANAWRKRQAHVVVFFIFLVANIGGSLTPLGDPPLFLGFLHGVPFFWTMKHVWLETSFVAALVLAIFYVWDTVMYRRESAPPADGEREPLRIEGAHNFLFLLGIVGAVLFSGMVELGEIPMGFGVHESVQNLIRDFAIVVIAISAYKSTQASMREANSFTWFPILEVAYLFAGIFVTIIPALEILKAGQEGALGFLVSAVNTPPRYFWATGVLSSFLDNAPTYLTFFNAALGQLYPGVAEAQAVPHLIGAAAGGPPPGIDFLAAISVGAVFMGANTYIGNAPNFMVKSIAEEAGIPMPTFFGYMLKYSIPVLVVVFLLMTLVFF